MSWTKKYWDAVEQLYWTPKYLGLESIPRSKWDISGDHVSIPRNMTNPNGPLYRRVTTGKEFSKIIRAQEETFNHIFELGFGILDGEIINDIFCELLGASVQDSLKSYGRDLGQTLEYPSLYGLSQPDGFFIGTEWTIALELKFDATTSMDQLAKYLLALVLEERLGTNSKPRILIYVAPNPDDLIAKTFPFVTEPVGSHRLHLILENTKPKVRTLLLEHEKATMDVLNVLTIKAFSWANFVDALQSKAETLRNDDPTSRTVVGLLEGLTAEIIAHPGSGMCSNLK